MNEFILRLKRSQSRPMRWAKGILQSVYSPVPFRIPGFLRPALRFFYELHHFVVAFFHMLIAVCYSGPLFQARCASFGRGVVVEGMPFVSGHVAVHIGNNVHLGGKIMITSGRVFDDPKLIIKDNALVGWNTIISVNREVVIEEHVKIAFDVRISDHDGHPKEADRRARLEPPDPKDVRPVRICRYAWIGNGSHVLKGVTIGEGAIIGAGSVVSKDVPPYSVAAGNPARVLRENVGLPASTDPAHV